MASDSGDAGEERPPEGVDRALEIAIAHMQVLLASIASFDGKVMFLTALNVAGISALVGIAASSDPWLWCSGWESPHQRHVFCSAWAICGCETPISFRHPMKRCTSHCETTRARVR